MSLFLAAALAFALPSSATEVCGHSEMYRGAIAAGLSPSFEKPFLVRKLEGLTDTDVQSYSVAVEPLFATSGVSGNTTMTVKSTVDGLNQFHFRLSNSFTISSVTLDGRSIAWTTEDSSHVRANFDQIYNTGETFTLVVTYAGPVGSAGFGSIEFGTHSGAPYCFTLSEPWLAYTWWPNKDDNTDKALMSIAVTVPNTMTVAANGLQQGIDTLSGNRLRYRFQSGYLMSPYLLCFGATNFTKFTDTFTSTAGTMPLEFYIWPEDDSSANRNSWLHVKDMLGTLGTWYGPYPFLNEKYGIYQFSFGGGMEHQTMTGENSFGDNLSVHELGHQWWGDNVTCATWQDIWLNEGFATYTEAVWLEKKAGSTGLPALKAAMQARIPSSVNGTVYCPITTDINRIFSTSFTYRKGGWVLHMLRHLLGDTTFWDGMALYRSLHSQSTATTLDFQHAMEQASGLDLTTFFQQWVYQPGAPQYQYGWTNLNVAGQNYVAMHIKQVQSGTYPTFSTPIDAKITAGATSTIAVTDNATVQNFLIPVPATTTGVGLDPDGWLLHTGIANVAYMPGPPKVVASNPLPGAVYGAFGLGLQISVTFHTPVNVPIGSVSMRRVDGNISIRIAVQYNPSTNTVSASFAPNGGLPPGQYELRIADTVTAVNSGQRLDGELNGSGSAAYPSGDGKPGGMLVIPFTVV